MRTETFLVGRAIAEFEGRHHTRLRKKLLGEILIFKFHSWYIFVFFRFLMTITNDRQDRDFKQKR